nr:hypothetical protein [Tanacetum cinerariifolium]
MLKFAQAFGHVVEGHAQLGQFIAADDLDLAMVITGGHRTYAFAQASQRAGQVLGYQPADAQRQRRTDQQNRQKQ